MSHIESGPMAAYESLSDPNLTAYFSNSRMRKHLIKSGLVTRRGEIVSKKVFRLNNARKDHQRHVRDLLAEAIVHKALDMERHRQMHVKKQLEEMGKIERVRRVRQDRALRGDEDILPLLSPKPTLNKPKKQRQRPHTAPSNRSQPDQAIQQSSGYPDEQPYNTTTSRTSTAYPKIEIDNQHLYQLDQEALRSFTLNLQNLNLGSGVSPYTVPVLDPPSRKVLTTKRKKVKKSNSLPSGRRLERRRQLTPTSTSNQQSLKLHRHEPPMIHRARPHSMCLITFKYLGKLVQLDCEKEDHRDEVTVYQQHCGGENLCVYNGKILPGDNFTIVSQRHRGFPFSLTFYLNGIQAERLSTCCEYKHRIGYKLGSKSGHFSFVSIKGAYPCFKCVVAKGQLKSTSKPSPPEAARPIRKKRTKTPSEDESNSAEEKKEAEEKYGSSFASSTDDTSEVSSFSSDSDDEGEITTKPSPAIEIPKSVSSLSSSSSSSGESVKVLKPVEKSEPKVKELKVLQSPSTSLKRPLTPVKRPTTPVVRPTTPVKRLVTLGKASSSSSSDSSSGSSTPTKEESPTLETTPSPPLPKEDESTKSKTPSPEPLEETIPSQDTVIETTPSPEPFELKPDSPIPAKQEDKESSKDSSSSSSSSSSSASSDSDDNESVHHQSPQTHSGPIFGILRGKKEINLSNIALSEDQLEQLCSFLTDGRMASGVTSLTVHNCSLGNSNVKTILDSLQNSTCDLKSLNIGVNGFGQECAPLIVKLLKKKEIESLTLDENMLGDNGVRELMIGVVEMNEQGKDKLEFLSLNRCGIDQNGANEIGKYLGANPILKSLHLSGNQNIGNNLSVIWQNLASGKNQNLSSLYLSSCKLGNKGMHTFTKFTSMHLERVNFADNNITDDGADLLLSFLRKNESLKLKHIAIAKGNKIKRKKIKQINATLKG